MANEWQRAILILLRMLGIELDSFFFLFLQATLRITGRKKHSEERAALFTVRVNAIVMCFPHPKHEKQHLLQ